ncbi:MAG: hypothetical protein HY586_00565 [Candidatus Omnitrophica bacterium]|nr:hypothetical protein [Candidatus Omnitrophota bacterium]
MNNHKKLEFPLMLLAISGLLGVSKGVGLEFAKVKIAANYLRLIYAVRRAAISTFLVLFLGMLLILGLIMVEIGVVLILPQSVTVKMGALFLAGLLNCTVAAGVICYLSSAGKWLQAAARHNKTLGKIIKEKTEI